jgi:hypothetical protein
VACSMESRLFGETVIRNRRRVDRGRSETYMVDLVRGRRRKAGWQEGRAVVGSWDRVSHCESKFRETGGFKS